MFGHPHTIRGRPHLHRWLSYVAYSPLYAVWLIVTSPIWLVILLMRFCCWLDRREFS